MGLSEEARAIVASNLTSAHCSLFGIMPNPDEGSVLVDIQNAVGNVYVYYLERLTNGDLRHDDHLPPG